LSPYLDIARVSPVPVEMSVDAKLGGTVRAVRCLFGRDAQGLVDGELSGGPRTLLGLLFIYLH